MSAHQWTAALALVSVIMAMTASIFSDSGEHQTYARLNPTTGKMELVDPVLLAASAPPSKLMAHGEPAEAMELAPAARPASLAQARIAVQPADKTQFVD